MRDAERCAIYFTPFLRRFHYFRFHAAFRSLSYLLFRAIADAAFR
jgi:hypothetical protein